MISCKEKEELINMLIHDTENFIENFRNGNGIIKHDFYCVGLTNNTIESSCEYSNVEDFENNLMKKKFHKCKMCSQIINLTNMYNLSNHDFIVIEEEEYTHPKQYIIKKFNIYDYKINIKNTKDDLNSKLPSMKITDKVRNIKCSPRMCSLIMSWILEILFEGFKISNIIDNVFACSNQVFLLEEMYDISSLDDLIEYNYCNDKIVEQIIMQLLLYLDILREYSFTQHPDKLQLSFDIKKNNFVDTSENNHNVIYFDIVVYLSKLNHSGITINTGNRKIRIYHSSSFNRLEHDDFSKKSLLDHKSTRFKYYYEPSNCKDAFYQSEIPYYNTTGTLYSYLILLMKKEKIREIVLKKPNLKKFWQTLWFQEEYNDVIDDIINNVKTSKILSKYHIIDPINYKNLFDPSF